ncbi:MAG TPA: Slp family lipoprotein [Candidatus Tectomicrobia bacterium]|nr:Slp family lipoprotein [Candidatus Tectomicrobia bacterium]
MYARTNNGRLWALICSLAFIGLGCAHVISESMRQRAQPPASFSELRANPEGFKGRTVILGGEILRTNNLREGTRIEILQRPLSDTETPRLTDTTGGRFMALCNEFLDPAVYAERRRITVGGQVLGSYTGKVGEVDYTYPVISCEETHLFPSASDELRRYASYPWWYDDPYFYPWVIRPYPFGFRGPYWRHW